MTTRLAVLLTALFLLTALSHAQSYLRSSLSVRPTSGLTFDTWRESILAEGKMAAVVAELSALMRDEKASSGNAVLLSLLLHASGQETEALTVLRQNALRHPADRMSLSVLAQRCAEAGLGEEQEAALTQLYQLPAPPHLRLECLRHLAMVRQSHGRLRELRDALVKQLTEQPTNA